MDRQDYRLKAAFVTFNNEKERFDCQKASPKSEQLELLRGVLLITLA